jgi:uncharacterized protein with WD repeat
MDQMLVWWPCRENDPTSVILLNLPTMEISEELVREFEEVQVKWQVLQNKLELLYRAQEGFKPREGEICPEFKKL